jgi:hypothetical protein
LQKEDGLMVSHRGFTGTDGVAVVHDIYFFFHQASGLVEQVGDFFTASFTKELEVFEQSLHAELFFKFKLQPQLEGDTPELLLPFFFPLR